MKSLIVIALALTSVVSFASDKKEVKATETKTVEVAPVAADTVAPIVAAEVAPVAKKTKKHTKKVTTEVKSAEVVAPAATTTTK